MEQCFLSHDTFWNTNFTKHGIFRNCHRLFREVIWYSHYEHPKCEILVNHIWSLCVFKTIFHFCSLFPYLMYSEAKFHDRAKFSKLFHHICWWTLISRWRQDWTIWSLPSQLRRKFKREIGVGGFHCWRLRCHATHNFTLELIS